MNEFAILITARPWTAQYEWFAHYPLAVKAGLDPNVAVIDLIAVNGYYDLVAMTLNVAKVGLPPGEPLPLKPLMK